MLGPQVAHQLKVIKPFFAHRQIHFVEKIKESEFILIPPEVLNKIVICLVRNAVENTPDGGCVTVKTDCTHIGPALTVKDTGVGLTDNNKKLFSKNYFPATEPFKYSTRNPYDFDAGGRGFDLLRTKIFSERYHFQILIDSSRCLYIPNDTDVCPGKISACHFCVQTDDCWSSGGTQFTIQFLPASVPDS